MYIDVFLIYFKDDVSHNGYFIYNDRKIVRV